MAKAQTIRASSCESLRRDNRGRSLILEDPQPCGSSHGSILCRPGDPEFFIGKHDGNQIFDFAFNLVPLPPLNLSLFEYPIAVVPSSTLDLSCTQPLQSDGGHQWSDIFHVSNEVSLALCGGIRFPNNQQTFSHCQKRQVEQHQAPASGLFYDQAL